MVLMMGDEIVMEDARAYCSSSAPGKFENRIATMVGGAGETESTVMRINKSRGYAATII
jgi:hypothetical protein